MEIFGENLLIILLTRMVNLVDFHKKITNFLNIKNFKLTTSGGQEIHENFFCSYKNQTKWKRWTFFLSNRLLKGGGNELPAREPEAWVGPRTSGLSI